MRTAVPSMIMESTASICSRPAIRSSRPASGRFADNLREATESTESAARSSRTTRGTPGAGATAAAAGPAGGNSGKKSGPFGITPGRQVVDVPATSEWHAYFLTHAPGEWWKNQNARAKFAEIYSETALVTLDWLGTVPENMDPTWVTRWPVDATGKPLPRTSSTKDLT